MKKNVVHIVLNSFQHDSRVMRACEALVKDGYKVYVIALWKNGLKIEDYVDGYYIKRIYLKSLSWSNNPFIQVIKYLEFVYKAIKLIKKLNISIYHCHDPSGLLIGYIAKIFWGKYLIYDSHELWGHTKHMMYYNKILYQIGAYLEKNMISKVDHVITVNDSIARILATKCINKKITVIRNIPHYQKYKSNKTRKDLGFPDKKNIIISVGSVSMGQGKELLIECMKKINKEIGLVFLGVEKLYIKDLNEMIISSKLENRVIALPPVQTQDVYNICKLADVGIALVENICLNSYYCLPNKFFEYIHSGLPVLSSNFPEMKKIINKYQLGLTFDDKSIDSISETIDYIFSDVKKLRAFAKASYLTSKILNWENEKNKLYKIYNEIK